MIIIDIAAEFSETPSGRFLTDGPKSGEKFREEHLRGALNSGEPVRVLTDDVEGFGSSFLEEAFGGLVRKGYFTVADLENRLIIVSDEDEALLEEVWGYIREATKD